LSNLRIAVQYRFGKYVLDLAALELRCDGVLCHIEPQAFHILQFLVRHRDHVVTKDELIEAVWDGRVISDSALNTRINAVRRAVGDDGKSQAVIKTFQKLGFRFVAVVDDCDDEVHQTPLSEDMHIKPDHEPLSKKPSIAVLPFDNMSDDPAQEYFSDGISEDLITALSKFHSFLVIARNSSFTYKGQAVDVKQVVRDLGVRYVVEGSVRKAGNQVRVTAQLIDGETGAHIWADRYDGKLDDIFVVQDEITRAISSSIGVEFTGAEYARAGKTSLDGVNAWDLAMRAGWHSNATTKAGNTEAMRLLKQAISIDPEMAHYHALLSAVYLSDAIHGWAGSSERSKVRAMECAQHAVSLDRRDAIALCYLGAAQTFARQPEDAIVTLLQSIECNPNLAISYGQLSIAHGHCGDYDACLENLHKAIRLSPRDSRAHLWKAGAALAAFASDRYDEAKFFAREIRRDRPEFVGGYRLLAACHGHLGEEVEAREALAVLLELLPNQTTEQVRAQVPYKDAAILDRYVDGLAKAGLPAE
jgi:TolB-like protein